MADMTCWCGTPFSLPANLYNAARNEGHTVYCPHGHRCCWKETQTDRERRRAEIAEQQNARLHDEIEAEKRRTAAAKGELTKHKKRSAAGTCPCCKRTFANMARHMKTQHPEFVAEQKIVPIKQAAS
jgi:hypothetical protein